MYLIESKRIAEHSEKGAPGCACVSYIHPTEPVLLKRMYWQIGSDVQDEYSDSISHDNGATWDAARPSLSRVDENGGHTIFVDNAILYAPQKNTVIHLVDQLFQHQLADAELNSSPQLRITVANAQLFANGAAKPTLISDFGLKQGLCVSFCTPLATSTGKVLVPVQRQAEDKNREISTQGFPTREDMNDILLDVWDSALLIGTWNAENSLDWILGNSVPYDLAGSSRGMCEGAVAELENGKLTMILRGSNAAWPEKPGYKWFSFSDDGGLNWTKAQPLPCDDGVLLQSSATGSALLRSLKNQKLYWIGNLCINGEHAKGNFPRSPLVICEVQEEPFALRRETITIIANREGDEDEMLQLSNFRFYQDRVSGDVVLYCTRYGERGSQGDDWLNADCYEYRVSLDEAASPAG